MIATLLGQLAGLARSIIVARLFGSSPEYSAFLYGNRVSETLFLLIAGGALGSAFIPTFTGFLAKDDQSSAWKLAASLARLLTITLSLLALLAAFFAPQIVRHAIAPGFASDPDLFSLTVELMRIQLIAAILFGLGGLIVGILNAHQIFLIPALTPAMYQLGIIFGALALSPIMGVHGLAWGVVIGAVLYLGIQIPQLLKLKTDRWSLVTGHWSLDSNVRHVLLLMGPRLIGVAVVQVNFWVNAALASQMSGESMAALSYAFALMLMAQAAIAQSVANAAMPTFSAQHALGQRDEMRASLAASLRGIIFLALPAALGLILLREPLVAMLYQRGEFDSQSTQLVSWALLWYAAGLPGHSIMEILTRAFYAQHDTKTPVVIGTIAMSLNVAFSFTFAALFPRFGWEPLGGLALANSLATALEAAALFVVMRKRLGGIEGAHVARGFVHAGLGTLGMSLALVMWNQPGGSLNRFVLAAGGILLGGLVYGAALILLRVPEIQSLIRFAKRKFTR
ncbi:MAG: Lipid II flippase MurJ [Anaerolineales bacterium]|nr:Lipid II flippase MurJ [Anaerolineales bacterium]